jgi:hypothetical protein
MNNLALLFFMQFSDILFLFWEVVHCETSTPNFVLRLLGGSVALLFLHKNLAVDLVFRNRLNF